METERYIDIGESKRWQLNTPIQIYLRPDLPHLAGHSKDLSLSGMQVEVGVKLPINSIVILEIYFQRSNVFDFIDQEPLTLKAQIVWRRLVPENTENSWEIGLRFIEITIDQQDVIQDELALINDFDED